MKVSDAGVRLIKDFEGLRLHAYRDSADVLTVGWGHIFGVYDGQQITTMEADRLLRADLEIVEKCLANCLKCEVTQNQYDALASWVFNLGCGHFRTSTLLSLINDGDDTAAAAQFGYWNHCAGKVLPGLTARREAEKELFLT